MLKIKRLFTNHWQLLFWPLVATLVFLPACGRYTVLPSPDSAPFYPLTYRIDRFVNLLAEAPSLSLDDLRVIELRARHGHAERLRVDSSEVELRRV